MPKIDPFEGLFGVFADSLPDGWGRLLVDRLMKKNGINPYDIGSLERLAIVGASGMGALTYQPVITMEKITMRNRWMKLHWNVKNIEHRNLR